MGEVRRAIVADAAELVRLRGVLIASLADRESLDAGWRASAAETLPSRLADPDPTLVGFVVKSPDRPDVLVASAVGVVEHRLAGPQNPSGRTGYVFNVVTDPGHRRRGYARRCVTALIDWYRDRGITTIDLRASADGEPLYRSLASCVRPIRRCDCA